MRWRAAVLAVALTSILAGCSNAGSPQATPREAGLVVPAHARAYFFGDSWTAGHSAAPGRGFPYVTSEMLGWTPIVDGVGGTGYLSTRSPDTTTYPVRAASVPLTVSANVIILEGGLNDIGANLSRLRAAALETYGRIKARFPHTPVVVLGPETPQFPASPDLAKIDRILSEAAATAQVYYVSPLQERWFTAANIGTMIDSPTGHPNTAGHAYIGGRLAVDIERLMRP